jgi:hypothetical protein
MTHRSRPNRLSDLVLRDSSDSNEVVRTRGRDYRMRRLAETPTITFFFFGRQ